MQHSYKVIYRNGCSYGGTWAQPWNLESPNEGDQQEIQDKGLSPRVKQYVELMATE